MLLQMWFTSDGNRDSLLNVCLDFTRVFVHHIIMFCWQYESVCFLKFDLFFRFSFIFFSDFMSCMSVIWIRFLRISINGT